MKTFGAQLGSKLASYENDLAQTPTGQDLPILQAIESITATYRSMTESSLDSGFANDFSKAYESVKASLELSQSSDASASFAGTSLRVDPQLQN